MKIYKNSYDEGNGRSNRTIVKEKKSKGMRKGKAEQEKGDKATQSPL